MTSQFTPLQLHTSSTDSTPPRPQLLVTMKVSRWQLRPRIKVATPWPTEIRGRQRRSHPQSKGLHVQMATLTRLPMASAASIPHRNIMGDLGSRRKSQWHACARDKD
ncbi:hypothetical protein NL676_019162 [Syzygium grande]|nr:hypothetical protein NL676_019162 [Syzygium grande]